MTPTRFTWKGWIVSLAGMLDGAGAWLWCAEIEGTDYLFVAGGKPDDDPEHVRHLVRDWIDDGMPGGALGA